jgi:hypothetical protein
MQEMQVRERKGNLPVAEEAGDAERECGVAGELVEIICIALIVAERLGEGILYGGTHDDNVYILDKNKTRTMSMRDGEQAQER